MQSQVNGNGYKMTVVCVDSYDKSVMKGRFYNPCLREGERFSSLMEFLVKMEMALDTMSYPQSFTAVRSFEQPQELRLVGEAEEEKQTGDLVTFMVRVLFRQNASWQGSILWVEGKREQSFRSALELVFLMNNALSNGKSEEEL